MRGDAGGGGTSEAAEHAGATVLAARAMSEGTAVRDAVAFVEASERLGAEMGAAAGWDSLSVHVEVPRTHLAEAMALFAEMALQPSFPEREVERLRDERLNDLQQVMADAAAPGREGLSRRSSTPTAPPTPGRWAASRRPSRPSTATCSRRATPS